MQKDAYKFLLYAQTFRLYRSTGAMGFLLNRHLEICERVVSTIEQSNRSTTYGVEVQSRFNGVCRRYQPGTSMLNS